MPNTSNFSDLLAGVLKGNKESLHEWKTNHSSFTQGQYDETLNKIIEIRSGKDPVQKGYAIYLHASMCLNGVGCKQDYSKASTSH